MEFLNNEIKFYEINHKYMKYLYGIDSRVYFDERYKNEVKPYVGIIITLENVKYFIPLTSAKKKHSNYKLKTKDYLLIYDIVDIKNIKVNSIYQDKKDDSTKKYHILSILDIRKMVPVPNGMFKKIEINSLELNYQFLFYKEHRFCKSNQDLILKNALRLYDKTKLKGSELSSFHCNYIILEEAMLKYNEK